MMVCKKYKNDINLFLDDQLPEDAAAELLQHMEKCSECRSYYHDMVRIRNSLAAPEKELPLGFNTAWKARIGDTEQKRVRFDLKKAIPALAAAVCGVFVVSGVVLSNLSAQNSARTDSVYQEAADSEAIPEDAVGAEAKTAADEIVEEPWEAPAEEPMDESAMEAEAEAIMPAEEAAASEAALDTEAGEVSPQIDYGAKQEGYSSFEVYSVDAKNSGIDKKEFIDYADEHEVEVTDRGFSVLLRGDEKLLNVVLDHYNLEYVSGVSEVEVIFE